MNRIVTGDQVLGLIEKHSTGVRSAWLVSPFLSESAIEAVLKVLSQKTHINLTIVTKWNPIDLLLGYSSIEAFDAIFERYHFKKWNIRVYVNNSLHAKVFLLGKALGIIGSMNLTSGGFSINEELGVAITDGDVKLDTLLKRIQRIRDTGYELTLERYNWKREKELPRFEARARAIKSVRTFIARERDQGLQSFIPGKKSSVAEKHSYFTGLVETLKFIDSKEPGQKKLHNWMDRISLKGGGLINEIRLEFLCRLGLTFVDQKKVSITEQGKSLIKKTDPVWFSGLLFGEYPEMHKLFELLSSEPLHPNDLPSKLGRSVGYWAVRLRWLVSLGHVSTIKIGRKMYFIKAKST